MNNMNSFKNLFNGEFDSLVQELIQIGKNIEDPNYSSSGFIRERDTREERRHPRAREIGKRLYKLDKNRLGLMIKAHDDVKEILGLRAASNLSLCWDEIGKEEWEKGEGECWLN